MYKQGFAVALHVTRSDPAFFTFQMVLVPTQEEAIRKAPTFRHNGGSQNNSANPRHKRGEICESFQFELGQPVHN